MNGVPYGGGGVMVLAGISYGQRTHLHFIDGHLNAQRYRDEIPRAIVVPFIRHHISYIYTTVFQFPQISSNFAQPLKSGTTFHRLQSTG